MACVLNVRLTVMYWIWFSERIFYYVRSVALGAWLCTCSMYDEFRMKTSTERWRWCWKSFSVSVSTHLYIYMQYNVNKYTVITHVQNTILIIFAECLIFIFYLPLVFLSISRARNPILCICVLLSIWILCIAWLYM